MHRRFLGLRFFLSWWAYSFPFAALAIASMLMFRLNGLAFHRAASWALLALLAEIAALLLFRTARAIGAGEICEPER